MIPFSHSKTLVDLDEGIYSIDLVVLDVGEDMSAILDEWQPVLCPSKGPERNITVSLSGSVL